MFFGILTLLTALSISAVAIYYSVAGLVAIFAAATIPIVIMGTVLEIGKLVTAVWLHRYWHQAAWLLKTYLSIAVVVLMFITSMGIFGFLSRAHIEQTANATEGLAQISRIDIEIARQQAIIDRAEQRIVDEESSITVDNTEIQNQIDKEQERIDSAYDRIQPAIDEQNAIIVAAQNADDARIAPFQQQFNALEEELKNISIEAGQYEDRLSNLSLDMSATSPITAQITNIEQSVSLVQSQLASSESVAIQSAQKTIGVEPDGRAGPNTRRAADVWIAQEQSRINELQSQLSTVRVEAQNLYNTERQRLTALIEDLRGNKTQEVKSRQEKILETIDEIRKSQSPAIQIARTEIQRIRTAAEEQIAQSNNLIQNLRESLTVGRNEIVDQIVAEQQQKIIEGNNLIDTLTQQKYQLQADYRKLEAEVGPVKYLAEFIYGEKANQELLEESVRWVILIIIFVFDPLAVLLLIASQATFGYNRLSKLDSPSFASQGEKHDIRETESNVASESDRTSDYGGDTAVSLAVAREGIKNNESNITRTDGNFGDTVSKDSIEQSIDLDNGMEQIEIPSDRSEKERYERLMLAENDLDYKNAKSAWKEDNPNKTLKEFKEAYIQGKIEKLPWEGYVQNGEQGNDTLWNRIKKD